MLRERLRTSSGRDGLLAIELTREIPEAMKPRKIDIGGAQTHTIDDRANDNNRYISLRASKQAQDA